MGDCIYAGNRISVDTYCGLVDGGRPRKRITVSTIHPDTGERQILTVDPEGWADLATAFIVLDGSERVT